MDYDLVINEIINVSSSFINIANELRKIKNNILSNNCSNNKTLILNTNGNNQSQIIKFKDFFKNNNDSVKSQEKDCKLNLGGKSKDEKINDKDGDTMVEGLNITKGSVSLRKDGRYMGRFYVNGVLKSVYGRTEYECINNMRLIKKKIKDEYLENEITINSNKKNQIGKDMSLNTWFDEYVEKYLKVKSSTKIQKIQRYNYNLRKSKIGDKSINKITVVDIQELFNNELDTYNRKKVTLQILKELFAKALNCGYIKQNVVERAEITIDDYKDAYEAQITDNKKILEKDEIDAVFNYMSSKKSYIPYLFICKIALFSGMRKGEILGLKWKDIDYDNKAIYIVRQFNNVSKKITTPKTEKSIRKVRLTNGLINVFEDIKKYNKHIDQDDFIIELDDKRKIEVSKYICTFFKKVNIKGSIHCFRHTYASYLRKLNVDIKVAQESLGHESSKTTQDTYQHLFNDEWETQFDKINNIDSLLN